MQFRIGIGFLIFCVVVSAAAQDTLYIRGFKGREPLVTTTKHLTLRLMDSNATPESIRQSYPELDLSGKAEKIDRYAYIVSIEDSANIPALLFRLNNDERVQFAVQCALSRGGTEVYLSNRVWVQLQSDSYRGSVDSALMKLSSGVDPFREDQPEVIRMTVKSSELVNYGRLLDTIDQIKGIRYMIPVFWTKCRLSVAPNDPLWSEQEQLWTTKLNLEHAFDFTLRPDSVSIHFFDDGVTNHEDFPQPFSIKGQYWRYYNDTTFEVYATSKHGMGTTGVLFAQINNSLGIAGFNNTNFKVRVQQICETDPYNENVQYFVDNSFKREAIITAAMNGADIMNHSWGIEPCDYDDPGGEIAAALDSAYKLGVLLIASSGNCDGTPTDCACVHLPARDPHVVAVGGINLSGDQRDQFANYGPELDVVTYSSDVPTLSLMGGRASGMRENARTVDCELLPVNYRCMSGTSISAPQATAIAGLVLAKRPDFKNKPDTLAKILKYSTDDGAAPCALDTVRHDDEIGYGRLDAYRTLHSVSRGNVNNAGIIDLSDLSYLIAFLTAAGPAPLPDMYIGDLNCDCQVNLTDLSALVTYLTTPNTPIALCFRFHS